MGKNNKRTGFELTESATHTVNTGERDKCKQCNNFIPVIDTALFSMAMDRGWYNTATYEKSMSADENFLFGGFK